MPGRSEVRDGHSSKPIFTKILIYLHPKAAFCLVVDPSNKSREHNGNFSLRNASLVGSESGILRLKGRKQAPNLPADGSPVAYDHSRLQHFDLLTQIIATIVDDLLNTLTSHARGGEILRVTLYQVRVSSAFGFPE